MIDDHALLALRAKAAGKGWGQPKISKRGKGEDRAITAKFKNGAVLEVRASDHRGCRIVAYPEQ